MKFAVIIWFITGYIKNPTKAAAVERELLELRDMISARFPGK